MSVNYKFKSAKDFDALPIDGKYISIAQLKEKIIYKLKLGNALDFDLVISNSETDEEYLEEDYLITENASLLVRRVPRKIETTLPKTNIESATATAVLSSDKPSTESGTANTALELSKAKVESRSTATLEDCLKLAGLTNNSEGLPVIESCVSLDEDSKIKEFIDSSAADWIRQTKEAQANSRGQGSLFLKKNPPQGYICHRCGVAGHYIQHCPTNGDPSYDVKKVKAPSGIPRTMLVANPDGSYALPTGEVAILQPNEEAFAKEIDGVLPKEPVTDIPPELCCPLCQKAMKDAVLTSKCCCKSFCDKCIRDVLLEKATCICGAKNVRADDLLPNRTLRETVERVLSGTMPLISTHNSSVEKPQSQDSTTGTDDHTASYCKQENEEEEKEEPNDEEIEELDYDGDGFDDLNMDEEYSDKTPESATTKAEEASPKMSAEVKESTPPQQHETKEEDEGVDTDVRHKREVIHRSTGHASVPSYPVQYTGYYAPYRYGFFPAFGPYSGGKAREGFETRKADLKRRRGYRDFADRDASYEKYSSRHRPRSGSPVKQKPQSSNRSPPRSSTPVKRRSDIWRARSRSRSRSPPAGGSRNDNAFARRARARSDTSPDTPNMGRRRNNWTPHKIQRDSYRCDKPVMPVVSRNSYRLQAQCRLSKADDTFSRRWDDTYHVEGECYRLQSDVGRSYRSSSKDECDSTGDDTYQVQRDRGTYRFEGRVQPRSSNIYENDQGSEHEEHGHGYTVLRGARGIAELGIDEETYRRHLEDVENPHRPAAMKRLRSMQMKLTYYKPDGLSRINHHEGDGNRLSLSDRFSKLTGQQSRLTGTNRDVLIGDHNDDEEDDVSVSCGEAGFNKMSKRRHMESEDDEFLLSGEEEDELPVPRRRGKVPGLIPRKTSKSTKSQSTYQRPGMTRFDFDEQDDGLVISRGPTGRRLRSKLAVEHPDDHEDVEMPRKRKLTSRLTEVNGSKVVYDVDGGTARKSNRLMSRLTLEDDQLVKRNRLTSRLTRIHHVEDGEMFVQERLEKVSHKKPKKLTAERDADTRGPVHERLGQALTEMEDEGRASVRERLGKRISVSERLTKTSSVFERINEDGKRAKGRKGDVQCNDVKSVFERISFSNKGNKGENVRSRLVVMI